MNNDEFKLLEQMYAEIIGFKKEVREEFLKVENKFTEIENKLVKIENKIENTMEPKLQALFDGQKQHTDILGRIEEEIVRHEEFIIKRIK